jgi:hypothetical protein
MAISSPRQTVRLFVERFVGKPIDIASLAAFRFLFGLMMAGAMIRYLAKGWVTQFYVAPKYYFSYPGFAWVHPWPDTWMHVHFVLLAVFALGMAVGFFYRICAALFFLGFTYVELIDQTNYLNHYYLISLLSGLMIFLPAHRAWSLDAWRKPELRLDAVPAWTMNLLRFQIGIVYFFAGLAKLNADWLFKAEPLGIWLAARSDLPVLGPLLGQHWVAYGASWFGAAFDLSIVFFLLWGRSRRIAYLLVIFFPSHDLGAVQYRDVPVGHGGGGHRLFFAELAASIFAPPVPVGPIQEYSNQRMDSCRRRRLRKLRARPAISHAAAASVRTGRLCGRPIGPAVTLIFLQEPSGLELHRIQLRLARDDCRENRLC